MCQEDLHIFQEISGVFDFKFQLSAMSNYAAVLLCLLGTGMCHAWLPALRNTQLFEKNENAADGGCCFPDEMEATIGLLLGLTYSRRSYVMEGKVIFSLDTNLGVAFFDSFTRINGQYVNTKIWIDFNETMVYAMINPNRCVKKKLSSEPMTSKCLSADAKKIGNAYLGDQDEPNRLNATWYMFEDRERGSSYRAYISFADTQTPNQCVPVTFGQYGTSRKVPYMLDMDFMNIVPKVKNSDVLKIPSICKVGDVQSFPKEFGAWEFILSL